MYLRCTIPFLTLFMNFYDLFREFTVLTIVLMDLQTIAEDFISQTEKKSGTQSEIEDYNVAGFHPHNLLRMHHKR